MLTLEQQKKVTEFHEMIQEELTIHMQSMWLDEDWCDCYMHTLQRLDQALMDIEELHEMPVLNGFR